LATKPCGTRSRASASGADAASAAGVALAAALGDALLGDALLGGALLDGVLLDVVFLDAAVLGDPLGSGVAISRACGLDADDAGVALTSEPGGKACTGGCAPMFPLAHAAAATASNAAPASERTRKWLSVWR
jgi:hypothetical protein